MILKNPPPAANGMYPLPPSALARSAQDLGRTNQAAARAKFAVLGYCRFPAPENSAALNADIAATPNYMANVMGTGSPGSTRTGAGGINPGITTAAPVVSPLGASVPSLPSYPCQTVGGVQAPADPSLPFGLQTPPCSTPFNSASCPVQVPAGGLPTGGAAWGNAPVGPLSSRVSSSAWWIVAGLLAGGAMLGVHKMGARR